MTEPSLDARMARLADGDRDEIAPVYAALWPEVHAFCARFFEGDRARADDVAQQALLSLFRRAHTYDAEGSARGWALAVAYWECRSERRRAGRRREAPYVADADARAAAPDPDIALREDLARAMGALSAADRDALRAAIDGASQGPTHRKRLSRARARLRALLGGSDVRS